MSELPELWNIDRLAGYLGVSKHFVYRLTSEHRIRFVKAHCEGCGEVWHRPKDDEWANTLPEFARAHRCDGG